MKTVDKIWILIPIGILCWALLGLYLSISWVFIGTTSLLASICALIFVKRSLTKNSKTIIAAIEVFKQGNRSARISDQPLDELTPISLAINDLLDKTENEEWRLNEKHLRYKSLVEMMADGLVTVNKEGIIQSVNLAAGKLLDFAEGELVGVNISTIITDPKSVYAEDYLNEFIDDTTGGAPNQEIEVIRKNGEVIPILFAVSKMEIQKQLLYIGVLSDISKIKSMEMELRSLNDQLSKTNERLEKR
jgi:PAS domain S-box-containing protein